MGPNDILHLGFASHPMRLRPVPGIGPSEPAERGGRASQSTSAIDRLRPVDKVEFSPEALRAAEASLAPSETEEPEASQSGAVGTPHELSEEEQREVDELSRRDREVRTHEQAHKAAAGQYGGAISYEFQTGPDGKRYVSGGSVPIDVSPAEDPRATIQKMRQVRGAALAPAEPSSADRQVAAQAQRQLAEAQRELATEKREELSGTANSNPAASGGSTVEGVTGSSAGSVPPANPSDPLSTVHSSSGHEAASDATTPANVTRSVTDQPSGDPRLAAPLAAYGRSTETAAARQNAGSLLDVRG